MTLCAKLIKCYINCFNSLCSSGCPCLQPLLLCLKDMLLLLSKVKVLLSYFVTNNEVTEITTGMYKEEKVSQC